MNQSFKQVKFLLPAEEIDMGGFSVKQPMPTQKIQQVDPFLLLHHARTRYSDDRPARNQGIGPHPHRGFSPVTFVIEGEIQHRDSWGNNQIAKAGEVQWLNAGAGIVHSERPSENLIKNNGVQEIIQLWINTPSIKKMDPPEYFYLSEGIITSFYSKDHKINNKLISGNYKKKEGNIIPNSEMLIIWSMGKQGGKQIFAIPEDFSAMLYVIKGNITIKGFGIIEKEQLVIFENEGTLAEIVFKSEGQLILLAGKPINEEVTQSGPYVMNNQTEILEAMRDYQMGKMGILIEED